MPKEQKTFIETYSFPFIYNNLTLPIGYPAERIKIASQLQLNTSTFNVLSSYLKGNYSNLFKGFSTSWVRQNSKFIYRTPLMVNMPRWFDSYQFNIYFCSVLKAFVGCSVDTLIGSPFENIKIKQMQDPNKLAIMQAANSIYIQRGFRGFFNGTNATIAKSFPSWLYLFLGYAAVKDKRDKEKFLSTILWATVTAVPITLFTNSFDVVKTHKQATPSLLPKDLSIYNSAKYLATNYGLFSLMRGLSFRLLHKSLVTAAGHMILDIADEIKHKPR